VLSAFFMKRIDFLWALVIFSTFSCSVVETGSDLILLGSWDATWQIEDSTSNETLTGDFVFRNDGSLTVTAYGSSGNLLASDTLSNTSNYRIEAGKILFVGTENEILSYEILYQNSQLIELELLEDIRITLKRDL